VSSIYFTIVSTVVFAFLFMIWKSSDRLNLSLRMSFLIMMVWGIVNTILAFVKVVA
jgi:hypothetical protein